VPTPPSPVPAPTPSFPFSCGQYGYFAGGLTGGTVSSGVNYIDRLNFSNDTPTLLGSSNLFYARTGTVGISGAVTRAYFMGGLKADLSGITNYTDVFDYDSETTSISNSADLKTKRDTAIGVSEGLTKGYIAGGDTSASVNVKSTEKIVFSTDTTVASTSLELANAKVDGCGLDGSSTRGYLLGGYTSAVSATTEYIDYSNDTKINAGPAVLSVARSGCGGIAATEAKGYVCGGENGATSTLYAITDIIDFATGSRSNNASANLDRQVAGSAGTSNRQSAGFIGGGVTDSGSGLIITNAIDKMSFTTDSSSTIGSTFAVGRNGWSAVAKLCRPLTGDGGYFVGGSYDWDGFFASYTATTDKVIFSADTSMAMTTANLTQARDSFASINGTQYRGYFAGGYDESFVNLTEKLIYANEYTSAATTANLTSPTHGACGLTDGYTKGYVIGGYQKSESVITDKIYKITYSTNETISQLTTARLATGLAYLASVSDNKTQGYLAGGLAGTVKIDSCGVMNFSQDTLTELTSKYLSSPRSELAGLDGNSTKGYFAGGDTANYKSVTNMDILTYATGSFAHSNEAKYNLQTLKAGLAGVSERKSKGYFGGGSSGVFVTSPLTDKVSFATGVVTATETANLTRSRTYLGGVSKITDTINNDGAYFVGGYTASPNTKITEKIIYAGDISIYPYTANLEQNRAYLAGISNPDVAGYIAGGTSSLITSFVPVNTMDKITYATDQRSAVGSLVLPASTYGLAGCSGSKDEGYFGGGNTGALTNKIYVFDYATEQIELMSIDTLDSNRAFVACISDGHSKGYWAGGKGGLGSVKTIEVQDIATGTLSSTGTFILSADTSNVTGSDGNGIEGFFAGGLLSTGATKVINVLSYTTGTFLATNPQLSLAKHSMGGAANNDNKGYFSGGSSKSDATSFIKKTEIIEHITYAMSTPKSAELDYGRSCLTAVSSKRNTLPPAKCGDTTYSSNIADDTRIFYTNQSSHVHQIIINRDYNNSTRFIISDEFGNLYFDTGYIGLLPAGCAPPPDSPHKGTFFKFFKAPKATKIYIRAISACTEIKWSYLLYCYGPSNTAGYNGAPSQNSDQINEYVDKIYSQIADGYGRSLSLTLYNDVVYSEAQSSQSYYVGLKAKSISCLNHYMAIGLDNKAYIWGTLNLGAAGNGIENQIFPNPVYLQQFGNVNYVHAGWNSSWVIRDNYDLYVAGAANYGALGLGISVGNVSNWTKVPGKFLFVGSNGVNTLALSLDSLLYFTGSIWVPTSFKLLTSTFVKISDWTWKKIYAQTNWGWYGNSCVTILGQGIRSDNTLWVIWYANAYPEGNITFTQIIPDDGPSDGWTDVMGFYAIRNNNYYTISFQSGYGYSYPSYCQKTKEPVGIARENIDFKKNTRLDWFNINFTLNGSLLSWDAQTIIKPPDYFFANAMNMDGSNALQLTEKTKDIVQQESSTKLNICRFAGRTPLQMVNSVHGKVAIRRCDILGFCCHSSSLPKRPEVVCCQTCDKYQEDEENPQTVLVTQREEILIDSVQIPKPPEPPDPFSMELPYRPMPPMDPNMFGRPIHVSEIEYKDLSDIYNSEIQDMNGFKIKPVDDLRPDVNDLLGE
jgi:hypothetical protein